MSNDRENYVRPAVLRFDFDIDPRVTLAANCKDNQSAVGPARAGCRNGVGGGACSSQSPS